MITLLIGGLLILWIIKMSWIGLSKSIFEEEESILDNDFSHER